MPSALVDSIRSVPLFADLSRSDVKAIAEISHEVFHDAGRVVIDEGESGASFHLILEGEADVLVGKRHVRRLSPGDYFGEISLIDGGPRTATVVTTTPMLTIAIPAWRFSKLLDRKPELARALLLGLCRAVRAQSGE